jgi:4,5-DOPA dioxygenase extradiol
MAERFPAIFVSHGAPTLPMETSAAREFLSGLGKTLGKPKRSSSCPRIGRAAKPQVSTVDRPDTIHDFYGFPDELYRLKYPAPGAPQLASRVSKLLGAKGVPTHLHPTRGLDHGAWVPLLLMYPDADIPVTQLTVQPEQGTAHHFQLGENTASVAR